jgi:hypothetical protein
MTGLCMFYPWRGNSPMDSIADTAEIRGARLRMRISHSVASALYRQERTYYRAPSGATGMKRKIDAGIGIVNIGG